MRPMFLGFSSPNWWSRREKRMWSFFWCFMQEWTVEPQEKQVEYEDPNPYASFLASRLAQLELDAIKMIICLHEKYPVLRTHIVHLSAADRLLMIKEAWRVFGLPLRPQLWAPIHAEWFSGDPQAETGRMSVHKHTDLLALPDAVNGEDSGKAEGLQVLSEQAKRWRRGWGWRKGQLTWSSLTICCALHSRSNSGQIRSPNGELCL